MGQSDNVTPVKDDGGVKDAMSGRRGSKKVRSGCITCKIRKVKCDEAKPSCLRCTKTGRKCDGYLDASALSLRRRRRRNVAIDASNSPESLSISFAGLLAGASPEERRSFDFFQHVTAPAFAGDLDGVFWRVLIPQFCHTEPAVCHAVLAVSSLHEAFLQPTPPSGAPSATDGLNRGFALDQYNTASALLLGGLKSMDKGKETQHTSDASQSSVNRSAGPLVAHVLFVCIEVMQGRDKAALAHIEDGRHLLGRLDARDPEISVIEQHLAPVYTRLSMTSMLFGGSPVPMPPSLKPLGHVPDTFDCIHTLRSSLHDFADSVLRFTQRARQVKYAPSASCSPDSPLPVDNKLLDALKAEQQRLTTQLSKLRVALSLFHVTQAMRTTLASSTAMTVLQIHLSAAEIWLATALAKSEMVFDAYTATFSSILTLAASVLDAEKHRQAAYLGSGKKPQETSPSQSVFTLETHVIPALYFVATKCRHSHLRHAALDLLACHRERRENLWRADILGAISARVIKLEEEAIVTTKHEDVLDSNILAGTTFETETFAPLEDDLYASWEHQGAWTGEPCYFLSSLALPVDGENDPISDGNHYDEQYDMQLDSLFAFEDSRDAAPPSFQPSQPVTQHSIEPPFDLPEHVRVHTTVVRLGEAGGSSVMVFRKPQGLDGPWDVRTEFVSVV